MQAGLPLLCCHACRVNGPGPSSSIWDSRVNGSEHLHYVSYCGWSVVWNPKQNERLLETETEEGGKQWRKMLYRAYILSRISTSKITPRIIAVVVIWLTNIAYRIKAGPGATCVVDTWSTHTGRPSRTHRVLKGWDAIWYSSMSSLYPLF